MPEPLPLPDNYNPETHLLYKTTENGTFHESRGGAGFARRLLANGHADDIALAHKVLEATLACQEVRENDPHYGNFFWMAEDDVVGDLNAVEFCLENLIPMMMDSADHLEPDLRDRVLAAIRLGLAEIARINVRVSYSNITMLDILNTCLGGELLEDAAIAQRGYDKLNEWIAYTDRSGTPREYNSPTYTRVCVNALGILGNYLKDEESRIRAKTFAARIGITVGQHIHPGTGRWAGPHSRAYHPTVVCEGDPEIVAVRDWIARGSLPDWVEKLMSPDNVPYEIRETASIDELGTLTTYASPSYSLGVASVGYGGQSNVVLSHFLRPGSEKPGVFFSRYLTNDKWLGDFYHATDRTKSRNLIDEGQFFGVQNGNKAIAVYAPQKLGVISSTKSSYVWTERDKVDEIWVDDQKVDALPADVLPGQTVAISSGSALFAIVPLSLTEMGRDTPIRLVERAGDLVLDVYNYVGPEKSFWEMGVDGPFWRGYPKNGVYIETAERNQHPSVEAFSKSIRTTQITDIAPEPFVADGTTERVWSVEASRDGETVGIEVDLMSWTLKRRWTQEGELGYPMLESPTTIQQNLEAGGELNLAGATVTSSAGGSVWMVQVKEDDWVVGYHGPQSTNLTLEVPTGRVVFPGVTAGSIRWRGDRVSAEVSGATGEPEVEGGELA